MLIDWFTVAAQAVNFLILVWLLKRFLYKPVLAAIDEREKRIASQLQDAEKKKADALKEQADFEHKNDLFDQQRAALLLEATQAAQSERDGLLATARKDAEDLRSKLQKAARDELASLNKKLGTLAQQEVFSIARKALVDLAGVSLEARIVDIFVQRLHGVDDKQKAELKAKLQPSSNPVLVRSAFDLAPEQKAAIEEALKPLIDGGAVVHFETRPDLVSGVELSASGQKIAWSISDYLMELTNSVSALFESKSDPDPVAAPPVPHAA